ncbi:MAG: endonuclease/exonuclease/phosphatase family protein [Gammaproteobacteria bacterium]|nr:endonuclease/exonuclease/phosphatase family protein [Gammaproteobacteria bacterium]
MRSSQDLVGTFQDIPMQYYRLRYDIPAGDRPRVIRNLQALRAQLDTDLPAKDSDSNLLLATWNIRDLGKSNRRGNGERLPESYFYIAEILSRFDFVAVQEVNELPEWERIMDLLGPNFDYIATDVTDSALGGNGERLTYLWDRRKVWFQKIVGEIVLPASMLISRAELEVNGNKVVAGKQFRRSPFAANFQSGWLKFDVCTVHIYYGDDSGTKLQERIEEIGAIATYLGKRADDALRLGRAIILLGDFNIVHPEHNTMQALLRSGFEVPQALRRPSNIDRSKYYDQIAFKTRREVLEYIDQQSDDPRQRNAGVFELFDSVFRDDAVAQYRSIAAQTPNGDHLSPERLDRYYHTWRTYQLSDHKPMWVRLQSDDSHKYLQRLAAE